MKVTRFDKRAFIFKKRESMNVLFNGTLQRVDKSVRYIRRVQYEEGDRGGNWDGEAKFLRAKNIGQSRWMGMDIEFGGVVDKISMRK